MLTSGRRLLAWRPRHAGDVGVLAVVLLVAAAFAIDGARVVVEQRHMQNAVDAAALAAARDLPLSGDCASAPGCPQAVSTDATAYSSANGGPDVPLVPCASPADTDCYVTPYRHNPQLIQVRLTETPKTFLLGELGLAGPVSVSSAATSSTGLSPGTVDRASTITSVSGGSDAALFASDRSCDAIRIESGTATFDGSIMTNGGIKTKNSTYIFNGQV